MPPSSPPRAFQKGDALRHRYNRDLGAGRVEAVSGRRMTVRFPKTGVRLTFAANDAALRPLVLAPGQKARLEATGEEVLVAARTEKGLVLSDGRVVAEKQLWPLEVPDDPVERLAELDVDRGASFRNRLDGFFLERLRQARGLGSFLGGRIHLYPHQLHVAERATAADPVRWLLADEVGLGKTIEACLILSRLLRNDRADRTLVVTPATLTVQWLGELYRRFHQTFVLLDHKRREDVAKEYGEDFNPFEAHERAIVSLEDLVGERGLAEAAAEADFDLLVVDEAHRLERARGDAGNEAYRAVAPLTRSARHVLLLSATPLEADTHAFFRLLQLVRPEAYASEEGFLASLERGEPLPPCTSATRRVDLGGLQPRLPLPVDLDHEPAQPGLSGDERADALDPRVVWLAAQAEAWKPGGAEEGKTLVFCHEHDTLMALKARLESAGRRRVAIFHERLSPERGDMEVAEFRRPDGPQFLVSTESGGEGRNFEFCRRLVLFDMPTDPSAVEQRIGRLDRVNRSRPVEIVYFRPPSGFGAELVALYERLGLFREPLGGFERSLTHVEAAVTKAERFWKMGQHLPIDEMVQEVRQAARARQEAVYHHLHRDVYTEALAPGIVERIPRDLDAAMERFVLEAADLFGFHSVERGRHRTWYVEFGSDALVEHVPGVAGGSRWLGTFDREEAVLKEELDFFASGHPLVEGIFRELQDGDRGRVALLKLEKAGVAGAGLLLVFQEGEDVTAEAIGLDGLRRKEWAGMLLERRADVRSVTPEDWRAFLKGRSERAPNWSTICRKLAARVLAGKSAGASRLVAVAGFRLTR
jgi:ATP-dependent helicase HepA